MTKRKKLPSEEIGDKSWGQTADHTTQWLQAIRDRPEEFAFIIGQEFAAAFKGNLIVKSSNDLLVS